MNKHKIRELREVLENTDFSEIEKKFGVKVTFGNASYTESNATLKMEISEVGSDGEVQSKEVECFKVMASLYGLKSEDLGREFSYKGKKFEIIGANSRARKTPILAKSKGSTYKFPSSIVKLLLESSL